MQATFTMELEQALSLAHGLLDRKDDDARAIRALAEHLEDIQNDNDQLRMDLECAICEIGELSCLLDQREEEEE